MRRFPRATNGHLGDLSPEYPGPFPKSTEPDDPLRHMRGDLVLFSLFFFPSVAERQGEAPFVAARPRSIGIGELGAWVLYSAILYGVSSEMYDRLNRASQT